MPDVDLTVKGLFELVRFYEREAETLAVMVQQGNYEAIPELTKCKASAKRCRGKAYQMLGVPTVDDNQKHMGELMADF